MIDDKLQFILNSARTRRFHTQSVLVTETVGEHSFSVAWLCWYFTDGEASRELLLRALMHDMSEHIVGDVPSPSRIALGINESLAAHEVKLQVQAGIPDYMLHASEAIVLDLADQFAGALYCRKEVAMGNSLLKPVLLRYLSYIDHIIMKHSAPKPAHILLDQLKQEFDDGTF